MAVRNSWASDMLMPVLEAGAQGVEVNLAEVNVAGGGIVAGLLDDVALAGDAGVEQLIDGGHDAADIGFGREGAYLLAERDVEAHRGGELARAGIWQDGAVEQRRLRHISIEIACGCRRWRRAHLRRRRAARALSKPLAASSAGTSIPCRSAEDVEIGEGLAERGDQLALVLDGRVFRLACGHTVEMGAP